MRLRHAKWGRGRSDRTEALGHMTSHDDLEDRLIWILGSPRTGSTWLLRMLIHPLALARNPLGFAAPRLRARIPAMPVVPLNEPYLPVHLTPLRIPPRQREGDPDASKFLVNSQREEDASYFFSREYEWAWRPELRRLILARFAAQVDAAVAARRLPTPLVAVKEPNGSHGAELLMSLFPRSRLIFLMRDGRDVLNSLLESQLPGGWREGVGRPIDSGGRRLEFVTTHSRLWVQRMNAVGSAFDRHPPDRRLRLRYEDLIVDAEGRMRQLFTWLGAEPRSGQVEGAIDATAKRRPETTAGRWLKLMNDREQAEMHAVMGAKLRELGYDENPAGAAPEAAAAGIGR